MPTLGRAICSGQVWDEGRFPNAHYNFRWKCFKNFLWKATSPEQFKISRRNFVSCKMAIRKLNACYQPWATEVCLWTLSSGSWKPLFGQRRLAYGADVAYLWFYCGSIMLTYLLTHFSTTKLKLPLLYIGWEWCNFVIPIYASCFGDHDVGQEN